jgi:hypothetical protein
MIIISAVEKLMISVQDKCLVVFLEFANCIYILLIIHA